MTPQLTPEQLRRIDALVAECMGYPIYYGGGYEFIPNSIPYFVMFGLNMTIWAERHERSTLWMPTVTHESWGWVERWMVDNFDRKQQADYAGRMGAESLRQWRAGNGLDFQFMALTVPLPARCLAFLSAMGKDVEEILK